MFKDHLGSILRVTNAAGTTEADQSFDAWGRRRNPTTWAYTGATPPTQTWLYRGYTAHEHLDQFALINMNGRLYDPTVGRMLSPDNYVQDALYAQTFNRYSYAHNNPLKFTDPDGENPAIVVGAVLGGLINLGVGIWRGEVHDLWDGIVYFGTGAAIGALAGATGGASLAGTGLTAASILGGAYAGAVGGAVGGMLQGIANATWQTIRYHAPTENIAKAGAQGLVAGAVGGAIIGGTVGGIQAAWRGANIWTGAAPKAPEITITRAGTVDGEHGFMNEIELPDGSVKTDGSFGGDDIKPPVEAGSDAPTSPRGLGSSRVAFKEYLQNAKNLTASEIESDLLNSGWKAEPGSPYTTKNGPIYKFVSENGKWFIRLDPPQGSVTFNHMHVMHRHTQNTLDMFLNFVNFKSMDAHIPIK